jgi:hypothetical protein
MSREETTSETKVWSPRYQWEDNIKLDLKEIWYCLLYINIFCHPKNAVRSKRPENGKPIVGFIFKTILPHAGRFWSRISYRRTIRQKWSISLHSPDLVIFTYSFDWNQRCRNSVFIMLLKILGMRRRSWKVFHKMVFKNASNNFTVAGRNVWLHELHILK